MNDFYTLNESEDFQNYINIKELLETIARGSTTEIQVDTSQQDKSTKEIHVDSPQDDTGSAAPTDPLAVTTEPPVAISDKSKKEAIDHWIYLLKQKDPNKYKNIDIWSDKPDFLIYNQTYTEGYINRLKATIDSNKTLVKRIVEGNNEIKIDKEKLDRIIQKINEYSDGSRFGFVDKITTENIGDYIDHLKRNLEDKLFSIPPNYKQKNLKEFKLELEQMMKEDWDSEKDIGL